MAISKTGRFPKEKIEISEYDICLSLISLVSNLLFNTALIAVSGNLRANVSNDQTTRGKPRKIDFAQTL